MLDYTLSYTDTDDTVYTARGYTGILTDPANVPTTGTATYNGKGWMRADVTVLAALFSGDATTGEYTGAATMTADFATSSLSVSMTAPDTSSNLTIRSINITVISIAGNGLSGGSIIANYPTTTMATTSTVSSDDISVEGFFFGPNAENVAGVFSSEGSDSRVFEGDFIGSQ